jgi:NADH-quinone oxidoreductase subunit N
MIFQSLLPEIFLISAALIQLFLNTILFKTPTLNSPLLIKTAGSQAIFILALLFLLFLNAKIECITVYGLLQIDAATLGLKLIIVFFSLLTIYLILPALRVQKLNFHEIFPFFFLVIFSLLLIICSQNLLSFYILLETQTICFYILSTYNRKSAFSTEAGLKYFISGSFMSGCFLLGAAILFSFLGTLNLHDIYSILIFKITNLETNYFLFISILLITSTLLFKIACAPFHF